MVVEEEEDAHGSSRAFLGGGEGGICSSYSTATLRGMIIIVNSRKRKMTIEREEKETKRGSPSSSITTNFTNIHT